MDVDLTAEQTMLLEAARGFAEARSPMSTVRRLMDEPAGFDRGTWEAAADLGWPALLAPEAYGGAGLGDQGVVEAAIVAEQLGRTLHPCPFLPVSVVVDAVTRFGSSSQQEALLPGLVAGTAIGTWCIAEAPGSWDHRDLAVTASRQGDAYVVRGSKRWALDAQVAEILLVTCRDEAGPVQFLVPGDAPGVRRTLLDGLDLGRRLVDVELDAVSLPAGAVLGDAAEAADQIWRQLALAAVLQCAESVGAAERVLEKTVAYARDRLAFGRPIGSFQAVKHRLAEAATWLEAAQAATWSAVHALADRRADAVRAVHVAKAFVSRHCAHIAEGCMQVHGGIAMTWDDDCHLYLRRLRSNGALFGTASWHADRLADVVGMRAR